MLMLDSRLACLGNYAINWPDIYIHQASSPFLLPTPLSRQPDLAEICLVGKRGVRDSVAHRSNGVLPLSVLATSMVLHAVLP